MTCIGDQGRMCVPCKQLLALRDWLWGPEWLNRTSKGRQRCIEETFRDTAEQSHFLSDSTCAFKEDEHFRVEEHGNGEEGNDP